MLSKWPSLTTPDQVCVLDIHIGTIQSRLGIGSAGPWVWSYSVATGFHHCRWARPPKSVPCDTRFTNSCLWTGADSNRLPCQTQGTGSSQPIKSNWSRSVPSGTKRYYFWSTTTNTILTFFGYHSMVRLTIGLVNNYWLVSVIYVCVFNHEPDSQSLLIFLVVTEWHLQKFTTSVLDSHTDNKPILWYQFIFWFSSNQTLLLLHAVSLTLI